MRDIPAAAEMDPDPLVLPLTEDCGGGGAGRNMVPSPKFFLSGMEVDPRHPAPAPPGHKSRDIRRRRQPSVGEGPWGKTGDGGRGGVVAPRRVLRAQATTGVGMAAVRRLESRDRGVRRGRVRSFGLDGPLILLLGFTRI